MPAREIIIRREKRNGNLFIKVSTFYGTIEA